MITIRCTRSRGPRGFFCLQVVRRGPVIVAVIWLKMIHSTLQLMWMAWPVASWIGNLFLPRRLHPVLLYVVAGIIGYVLLVTSVFALDSHLEAELDKFDLNGDGGFDSSEMTPAAQQAMDDFTHDTGRTFAPIFGAPITAIWLLLNFAILYCGEWVYRTATKPRENNDATLPDGSRRPNDAPNPYRPPNAR